MTIFPLFRRAASRVLALLLLAGTCLPAHAADIAVTVYADAGYQPYSYAGKNGEAAGL